MIRDAREKQQVKFVENWTSPLREKDVQALWTAFDSLFSAIACENGLYD